MPSNYRVGQTVRVFGLFIVGFFLTWTILPQITPTTPNERGIAAFVVGIVLGLIGKGHT